MREENGSELSISKVLFEFLRLLVKILIVLIIVETFVMKGYRIPSSSMEETLLPGDYVLVERMSKWDEAPKRSDIVVFRYPRDFREDYIKRVVALPGDELILQAGKLVLNGEIIDDVSTLKYRYTLQTKKQGALAGNVWLAQESGN